MRAKTEIRPEGGSQIAQVGVPVVRFRAESSQEKEKASRVYPSR